MLLKCVFPLKKHAAARVNISHHLAATLRLHVGVGAFTFGPFVGESDTRMKGTLELQRNAGQSQGIDRRGGEFFFYFFGLEAVNTFFFFFPKDRVLIIESARKKRQGKSVDA
ncbi:hypothetical protein ABW19_dt0209821 [Dactylella cylindrospora]|nr:hypothetical protein ABW19_dt0209821 [Dactylella cylindrospora]